MRLRRIQPSWLPCAPSRPDACGLLTGLLACVLPLTACTDDSDDPPPSDGPESVALELSLGPGADDLTTEARDDLQNDVGAVLTTYVVEGFLGDYPRDDFVRRPRLLHQRTWPRRAAQDIDQITGAGFERRRGGRGDPASRPASPPSLPAGKLGVSAAVDFAFDVTEGGTTARSTLHGRLMLTPENGEWRIFGYDAADRDQRPTGGAS